MAFTRTVTTVLDYKNSAPVSRRPDIVFIVIVIIGGKLATDGKREELSALFRQS